MDFRLDSDVSDGGGCLLVSVTVGKSGSTGNHRIIQHHQWKSSCNANWYNQLIYDPVRGLVVPALTLPLLRVTADSAWSGNC